mgnify:CR=1 FL=1
MKNTINLNDQVIMISGVSGQLGQIITNEALKNNAKTESILNKKLKPIEI